MTNSSIADALTHPHPVARSLCAIAVVAIAVSGYGMSTLLCVEPASATNGTIPSGAGPNGPQSIVASDFVPHVHNPYFPLRPGTTFRYRGTKDGKSTADVYRVTDQIRRILGVPCVSVKDKLYENGSLEERTTDWYAEDRQGRVWYFGESTAELNPAGKVISTEGSWQSGVKDASPGIFMPKVPQIGQSYRQEYLKGEAEDHFKVMKLHAPVTVPAAHYHNALLTKEWTPLEPGVIDHKYYVRGIGEVSEETIKGPLETSKLVAVSKP